MCEICGRVVGNIALHMSIHNRKRQPLRVCDKCGKQFSSLQSYGRHRKTFHSGRDPFLCDACGKPFRNYDVFKAHVRIHIGNKNHICPVCDKGFLEKSYMKKHLKTHYAPI